MSTSSSVPSVRVEDGSSGRPRRRTRNGVLRTGLVMAAALGVLDIAAGLMQFTAGADLLPNGIAVSIIVLGAGTVVLVPFAWRGARWASWTVAAMRGASALTGVPAFFVPGVPAGAVIAASVGILLAVVVATLIAFGLEGRR